MKLLTCALALSITVVAQTPTPWNASVQQVESPAGANTAQPQLTVSERGVILSWIERPEKTATLKFSERVDGKWSTPMTVASGDDWFVNWADVPSVLRLDDGTLAAHWLQKSGADTYAYDVRLAFSRDNGKTWTKSIAPHSDGTKTEHGFASLFQMPGQGLGLVWLDGRAMKGGHDGHGGGDMSLRFGVFSRDGKQITEEQIDGRVCECCPTSVAVTSDGILAAFRDRSMGEVRDIYISRYANGKWSEPYAAHHDNWRINACPVNGPTLSARGNRVAIGWFNGKTETGESYVAFSSDAGRTFGTPIRLDEGGTLGRVDVVLLEDGSAVAGWIEYAEKRAQFRLRRVEPNGTRSPFVSVAGIEGNRASGYPRLAAFGDEIVLAWIERENNVSRVKTSVVKAPRVSTAAR